MQEEMGSKMAEVTTSVAPKSTLVKDMMIPLSIVIAGVFIGAGLYFSGGATPAPIAQVPAAQNEQVDNTSKVNPVTDEDHVKGNRNATITIVEYSDFDCPFCSRFHDVMNSVVAKYEGEVAWVFRQFPLEQLHPNAPAVAIASECVADLGGNDAFWKFSDAYFAARGSGDATAHNELLPRLVVAAGVSPAAFTECFEGGTKQAEVQEDMDDAVETGGRGTPWSILIGPSGKTYPINGALPQQSVEQLIEIAKQEA